MNIKPTYLDEIFFIENKQFTDQRGLFVKTFHEEMFTENKLAIDFKESFYSVSKKNVIRGLHFQTPPHDHAKLVYVVQGEILDVVVDIREGAASFGKVISTVLSAENARSIYIGRGYAHGFLTLSDEATVVYMTTTMHAPSHDSGVLWNSIDFDWHVDAPIVSERDSAFVAIDNLHAKAHFSG